MQINQFFLAGINYKKTDASVRGLFAVNHEQYAAILDRAAEKQLGEVFILSTCNRTEIYGLAGSAEMLAELLCGQTAGDLEMFTERAYFKKGEAAVEHLFHVAAGLDSQIIGDYEIVGQIRQAAKFARQHGFIGTYLERLVNSVVQASKAIKSNTALSGGTVSVSFAAIQFLKETVQDISDKKIVLLGTGKIGNNTCRNLVDYLHTTNITLVNRTEDKAVELAQTLGLTTAPFSEANNIVAGADIVIVATNADQPVITQAHLEGSGPKILIDLSIPNNIDPAVKHLPGMILANVDDLSKINDATLQKRLGEVPRAKAIIREHMDEYNEWVALRKHVPVLKAVKQKLIDMHGCSLFIAMNNQSAAFQPKGESIQKVINSMALKMREQHTPGCHYIAAINDYITSRAC